MDPDPWSPKTYGSDSGFESGSATLISGMSLLGRVADPDSDESAFLGIWIQIYIKVKIEELYRLKNGAVEGRGCSQWRLGGSKCIKVKIRIQIRMKVPRNPYLKHCFEQDIFFQGSHQCLIFWLKYRFAERTKNIVVLVGVSQTNARCRIRIRTKTLRILNIARHLECFPVITCAGEFIFNLNLSDAPRCSRGYVCVLKM